MYIPSLDILIRSKGGVQYRHESGQPEAVGCLLLYFLLRHNKFISIQNIKIACEAISKDPRCGWKQATSNIDVIPKVMRLQQRLPVVPKTQHGSEEDENEMKMMEKFSKLCKPLVDMVKDSAPLI